MIDKGQILEKKQDQEIQADRTRRNVCARCGLDSPGHTREGDCKDGGGSYTWCHSREDTARIIAGLESVISQVKPLETEAEKPENADARRMLDIIVTASTGSLGRETPRTFLARMRGVDESTLGDVTHELKMLDNILKIGPSIVGQINFVKLGQLFCDWTHPRALEAIKKAEANGWIAKGNPQ